MSEATRFRLCLVSPLVARTEPARALPYDQMSVVRFMRLVGSVVFAALALSTTVAGAQGWRWNIVAHDANGSPINEESTLDLSGRVLTVAYSAQIDGRSLPMASCHADIGDIAYARPVTNSTGEYLFVVMKPHRSAACTTGNQPVAIAPVATGAAAGDALTSIMRSCCSAHAVAQTSSPPRPQTPPLVAPQDWIEDEGLFAFVRVRNRDARSLTIDGGTIVDCRNVVYGCRRFIDRPTIIAPNGVATIATVMAADSKGASFSYRYDAQIEAKHYTGTGLSTKLTPGGSVMTTDEIRGAEAVAVSAVTGHAAPAVAATPSYTSPQLIRRGTSSLAIGKRGQALVRVNVDATGVPQNAAIVSISNRALIAAALQTAVSSGFAPAKLNGRPVSADYVATFKFDGTDPQSNVPVWRVSTASSAPPSAAPAAPTPAISPPPADVARGPNAVSNPGFENGGALSPDYNAGTLANPSPMPVLVPAGWYVCQNQSELQPTGRALSPSTFVQLVTTTTAPTIAPGVTPPVRSGSSALFLGNANAAAPPGVAGRTKGGFGLCQDVVVPAGASLTFFVNEGSGGTSFTNGGTGQFLTPVPGPTAGSFGLGSAQEAAILSPASHAMIKQLFYELDLSQTNPHSYANASNRAIGYQSGYVRKGPYDLRALAGQTITLYFGIYSSTAATSSFTFMAVDDVDLSPEAVP
jgi:hypothetical protein